MTKTPLTGFARRLRRNAPEAEKLLWRVLRNRSLDDLKFRRQQPIGKYIADFVCFEKRLIVEVDGGQHAVQTEKDKIRDNWFEDNGYSVLRFWNNEVLGNLDGVVGEILERCKEPSP